ncbi:MAG: DUF1893 domain-containing protein [Rikenellaceae bacterium]|nr:DUF1893 domain-containing protein [Rikenellaceae bacterium]
MDSLIEILHSSACSCVVRNKGRVERYYNRGVKDLYTLYTADSQLLSGADVADKVVGRAAAAIMILGGVRRVYADTISQLALELFAQNNVEISYNQVVPYIINRAKTDLCPLERATKDLESLEDIFAAIEAFVSSLA